MKLKPAPAFRVLGTLWLCSLVVYLFLGLVDCAEEPPLCAPICATAGILWIVDSVLLVVLFVRSRRTARTAAPDAPRRTMARWFAAIAGGLLGGVAATLANHLFPGCYTVHANIMIDFFLFALIGMLVGAIPLAFPFKPRKTALLAFLLSAAFSWWVIVLNFR